MYIMIMLRSLLFCCALSLLFCSATAEPHSGRRNPRHHDRALAVRARGDVMKRDTYTGRATFFIVGLGACGDWSQPSDFLVALNTPQYGYGSPGPQCFKTITIQYNGNTQQATILDECPSCNYGDLDMSQGLFDSFADPSVGEFQMTWWFNDGSSPAPTTTSQWVDPAPWTTDQPTTTSQWVDPAPWTTDQPTTTSQWVDPAPWTTDQPSTTSVWSDPAPWTTDKPSTTSTSAAPWTPSTTSTSTSTTYAYTSSTSSSSFAKVASSTIVLSNSSSSSSSSSSSATQAAGTTLTVSMDGVTPTTMSVSTASTPATTTAASSPQIVPVQNLQMMNALVVGMGQIVTGGASGST